MKVLIVTQYFWPENLKGNDIAKELVKKGHQVTVLTAKPNYPKGDFFEGYSFFGKRTEFWNGVEIFQQFIIHCFGRIDEFKRYLYIISNNFCCNIIKRLFNS